MATGQKRIAKELQELTTTPPDGISVSLIDESDLYAWKASIQGPEGTPYAAGTFHLLLTLPQSYPFKPPTLSFLTKIYHPNVSNDVPANAITALTNKQTLSQNTSTSLTTSTSSSSQTATTAPATTGLMCLGPLRPDAWKPSTKISAILEFARQLLREPNADDAVETRIADEYKNDRKAWEKEAKEYTKRFAMGRK